MSGIKVKWENVSKEAGLDVDRSGAACKKMLQTIKKSQKFMDASQSHQPNLPLESSTSSAAALPLGNIPEVLPSTQTMPLQSSTMPAMAAHTSNENTQTENMINASLGEL